MTPGRAIFLACAGAALCGCQREERMVNYKPFFAGMEGASTKTPAVVEKSRSPLSPPDEAGTESPDALVRKNPDGTTTLLARSGIQLMYHIRTQLAGDDAGLFADQVLCTLTREEYTARGLDPRDAFKTLKPQLSEISKLFARMPLGEHSPNVNIETVGRNIFRVQLRGQAAKGLEMYTGFDMALESGHWRLRWFVR